MKKRSATYLDVVGIVSGNNGKSKKENKEVLDEFLKVIIDLVEQGFEVKLSNLGMIKQKTRKAREEREGIINPSTQEKGIIPAIEAHSRPTFQISKPICEKVKQKTLGDPIE